MYRSYTIEDAPAASKPDLGQQNVLRVIRGVLAKVMSDHTNHIVHSQYEWFMKGYEWPVTGKSVA